MNFGKILFFGLLVALGNVLGGLILARPGATVRSLRTLKYLVALGAGFMLAAIFIEIVPNVVELWSAPDVGGGSGGGGVLSAMVLLLGGYLLVHFVEHTIAPHFHFGAETHPEALIRPSAAYTAIGGLTIHTFFDGASVAAAFLVGHKLGLLVFLAVLLHKVPEGFTAASIVLASGPSSRNAFLSTLVIGAARWPECSPSRCSSRAQRTRSSTRSPSRRASRSTWRRATSSRRSTTSKRRTRSSRSSSRRVALFLPVPPADRS